MRPCRSGIRFRTVNTKLRVAAAAVLTIGAVAGCSSDKAAAPRPGVLPPGTAVLSVEGKDVGTTHSVRCGSIDWMTKIQTSIDGSSVNAMVSNAAMTGPTYHITGAALGFNESEPIRLRAETFTIKVSC
jgi:lipoprotein LpqH